MPPSTGIAPGGFLVIAKNSAGLLALHAALDAALVVGDYVGLLDNDGEELTLRDRDGRHRGAIESVRDITDRRRAEEALQNAHDLLEQRSFRGGDPFEAEPIGAVTGKGPSASSGPATETGKRIRMW